jgi:hypothetical protein
MTPPQPNENDSCKSTSPRLTVEALLNLINDKAQFVQFTLDHDRLEESSLALLQIVFPDWFSTSPKNHLKLVQCTNGITNKRTFNFNVVFSLHLFFLYVRLLSNEM